MAWEHFTDYLAEGELLTAAQYGELLDAIEERLRALDSEYALDTDTAAFRSAGLLTDYAFGNAIMVAGLPVPYTEKNLYDLMNMIGTGYLKISTIDDIVEDGTNEVWEIGELSYQAGLDLGYCTDLTDRINVDTILLAASASHLNQWKYWNLMRRMVQLLRVCTPLLVDGLLYTKQSTIEDEDDPETLQESMQDATETSAATETLRTGYDFAEIKGQRAAGTFRLAEELYPLYSGRAVVDITSDASGVGDFRVKWGATTFDFTITDNSTQLITLGDALDATGEVTVEMDFAGYYVGGVLLETYGTAECITGDLGPIALTPTFSHPFE